jgi:hypothetical protein
MKRILITVGAALLAAVPATMGLVGNTSFAQNVPVRVPSQASVLDDHGGLRAPTAAELGDDNGRQGTHAEPGDDRSGTGAIEPGDDNGGQGNHAEPGDDKSGTSAVQPGDDKSGSSAPKASDDKSGSSAPKASDDKSGTSATTPIVPKVSDKGSGKGDNGGHVVDTSKSGGKDDGSGHS